MIVSSAIIKKESDQDNKSESLSLYDVIHIDIDNKKGKLTEKIGTIEPNKVINFWSFGNFSMHQLILYILSQTGPSEVLISSWSLSQDAIEKFVFYKQKGLIKNIEFVLDPRVKVRNPKPLQMLQANFKHRLTPIHAKVAVIMNKDWQISVVSSQNLTINPRIERGLVCSIPEVARYDYKMIKDIINEQI